MRNPFNYFFLLLILTNCDQLLARGEHRIQVQNYGRRDPEIPIWIMESNYYNAHHDAYMIRIEDLNETLNKEINEEVSREYSEWFNAEFNRRMEEVEAARQEAEQELGQEGEESEDSKQ